LMTWTPPVLKARYPFADTLHLGGRGLRLVPSFFCWRYPVKLADPRLTPTLVYPIEHRPCSPHTRSSLGALMGPTRATLLKNMVDGCSTTQAARRAGISPPTATHHAKILRDANLITSRRDANAVVHTVTALGMALLNAMEMGPDEHGSMKP
jgi:DNA-binding transcriptional ArsR family regulator